MSVKISRGVLQRRGEFRRDNPLSFLWSFATRRPNRKVKRGLYADPRWRKLRARQLASEPLCRACGVIATQVDHITPHNKNPKMFFDAGNLQSLCGECHQKKTRRGL